MSEIAFNSPRNYSISGLAMVSWPKARLDEWIDNNIDPADGVISLDFEASGRHPDGNWATDASKCEPEARVSIAAMAWVDDITNALMSCAIPFDQGMIGGKLGRYITKVTKKTPVFGWETIPHTEHCVRHIETYSGLIDGQSTVPCTCAPWNFGDQGWRALVGFWESDTVKSIDYFNAKYDMWIALAGLRPTEDTPCIPCVPGAEPGCVGWQHRPYCLNAGTDLGAKLGRDVMIFEAIRDPAEKASLDNVARKFFAESKDKGMDEGLKANGVGLGKRYDLVDWRIAGKYAAMDAELTLRAKHAEDNMYAAGEIEEGDMPIIRREHRKILTLWGMERAGVPFNVELCREQATKMHAEVAKLIGELPFTDNSIAAGKYFFGPRSEGGLELMPIKMTPGSDKNPPKPSCDAEVVAKLAHMPGKAGEVGKLWQHIANMKSVCSKWYDAWPHRAGKDGRLRTNFWQCAVETDRKDQTSGGAISGRLSATRVQLQGVPQDWRIPEGIVGIKDLMIAEDGCEEHEFDASNAEVRMTAWLSKCHKLADVINSGVNIHSANTVVVFGEQLAASWPDGWPEGLPYSAFKRAGQPGHFTLNKSEAEIDKDGDPVYVLADHPEWKKYRTSMKRGIFGTIYASGVRTLKSQIDADLKDDIPERQIRAFMDALTIAYPEIKRTSKACERKVDVANGGPGYVKLVSGRRRVFGWGERTYKALNACVQGGVAELMSELMIAVADRYPGMVRNQVHDSLWVMIPKDQVDEVSAWIRAKGKEVFEQATDRPDFHVDFKFDGKRMA